VALHGQAGQGRANDLFNGRKDRDSRHGKARLGVARQGRARLGKANDSL